MDKLKMHTPNETDESFKKLTMLFPDAVTEMMDENGEVVRAIDEDVLMREIFRTIVDGNEEHYQFIRPDKRKTVSLTNAPLNKILRPHREESVDLDNTKNLYTEGDNLEVLRLLQETYLGKIKMIYIDPPYSIGHDFVYRDDFSQSSNEYLSGSGQFDNAGNRLITNIESNDRFHADWLSMMYPHLRLAKDLLAEGGVIFISIDDNEQCNLIKLCGEVFGAENYIGPIIRSKQNAKNDAVSIQKNHEFILVYRKSSDSINRSIATTLSRKVVTYRSAYEDNERFYYLNNPITTKGEGRTLNTRPDLGYTVYYNPKTKDKIAVADYNVALAKTSNDEGGIYTTDNELLCKGYVTIRPPRARGKLDRWAWALEKFNAQKDGIIIADKPGSYTVRERTFVKKEGIVTVDGKMQYTASSMANSRSILDFSTNNGTNTLNTVLEKNAVFSNPRNLEIIKYLIQLVAGKSFVVLNFFSGSATTAHAVMQVNARDDGKRRSIMVQISEGTEDKSDTYKAGYKMTCEVDRERIRRAVKKIAEKNPGAESDNGFHVLKCDASNMEDVYYNPADFDMNLLDMIVDNIKEDKTPEALLFQTMLDLGVELSSKIEETTIAGKKVFDVADGLLVTCFDKDVNEETVRAITQEQPYYFVTCDSSPASDSVATNFRQIFATYSPDTVRKVL